jgi:hypothetical protein
MLERLETADQLERLRPPDFPVEIRPAKPDVRIARLRLIYIFRQIVEAEDVAAADFADQIRHITVAAADIRDRRCGPVSGNFAEHPGQPGPVMPVQRVA